MGEETGLFEGEGREKCLPNSVIGSLFLIMLVELVVETVFSVKYQNLGSNYFLISFTFYCTLVNYPQKHFRFSGHFFPDTLRYY